MKNILKGFTKGLIGTICLLLIGGIGYIAFQINGWSSEGGLGLTQQEWNNFYKISGTTDLTDNSHVDKNKWYDLNTGQLVSSGGSSPAPSSSAPSPAVSVHKSTVKAKEYSHDYDSITDLAKEAFVYFTQDGTPDSVYLNIKSSSSANTITGKELNATTAGNEDGRISFVDDDKNVLYEYLISGWQSDADFSIDLGASFEKYDTKDFEEAYTLHFDDGNTISGNDLTFRVQTGLPDTELSIYIAGDKDEEATVHTDNRTVYEKIHTGLTDADGFLELHPSELSEYVVSPGEPVMVEDEIEEPETIEEPEPEAVKEPEKPSPVPVSTPEPEPEKKFSWIPVAIGGVVLLIAICVAIILKKKKK